MFSSARSKVLPGLGVIALLTGAFLAFDPTPPRRVTLATGLAGGAYHQFGERLAARLARDGLTLTPRPTQGSVENPALPGDANSGVEFALVQTGLD